MAAPVEGSGSRAPEKFQLPERSSRGKRMTQLLEGAVEADEQFWNQDALREEEGDVDFNEDAVPQQEDIFDSDFGEDEPEEEEGEGERSARAELKAKRKRPIGYGIGKRSGVATSAKKKGKKEKVQRETIKVEEKESAEKAHPLGGSKEEAMEEGMQERPAGEFEQEEGSEGERVQKRVRVEDWQERRKSSRSSVLEKALEREAVQEALKSKKPVRRRAVKAGDDRRWTQEEMLLEAAQTEVRNSAYLELLLAREEEVKHKAVVEKVLYGGPAVKLYSKEGKTVIEFTQVSKLPPPLNSRAPPYPCQPVCAVTGRTARYKDPLTGLPYADAEAFRVLRSRGNNRKIHA